MLADYNLRLIGPDAGPRYVEVPERHPALGELLNGNERPIGATGTLWTNTPESIDRVFLFTYEAWQRVAARQTIRFQTTSDPNFRPTNPSE
jgi:hypothetical protein